MSTNSNIIVQNEDGTFGRVYCHFDGYLSGVGELLQKHYNDVQKARELIREGDMSSLDERCDKPEGHTYETPKEGYTVYYGRDRQEDDVAVRNYDTLDEAVEDHEECLYVWKDGAWWTKYDGQLILLTEALEKEHD